jgi:hypothetical protein
MKFFSFVPVFAALVVAVAGVTSPGDSKRELVRNLARDNRAMTNADLRRRGLKTRAARTGFIGASVGGGGGNGGGGTGGGLGPRNNNSTFLGFISSDLSSAGRIDSDIENALSVNFETDDETGDGSNVEISISGLPGFPLFGLVQGRDSPSPDLAVGSPSYLNVAGVANPGTPPGAYPTLIQNTGPQPLRCPTLQPAETSVWNFNSTSGALNLQWINTDGSAPVFQIFTQNDVIYFGSDPDAFQWAFPCPITVISFSFIPQ